MLKLLRKCYSRYPQDNISKTTINPTIVVFIIDSVKSTSDYSSPVYHAHTARNEKRFLSDTSRCLLEFFSYKINILFLYYHLFLI